MTPGNWFRSRFGCASLMGMAIVFAVAIYYYFGNPVLAAGIIIAVVVLRLTGNWQPATMRLMVSPGGIGWTCPGRPAGMIVWRDVGALVVRQAGARGELAVYLVPRDAPEGRWSEAFMMTTGDLGLAGEAGEERIRRFVGEVMPYLPGDAIVDRETRRWLATWRMDWTPGKRPGVGQ